MNIDDRFASTGESVAEIPEPFQRALLDHLSPHEPVSYFVYGPAFSTLNLKVPTTVLTLTDRRWLIVSEEDGSAAVDECDFGDTLLLQFTSIMVSGELKIDFIKDGEARSSAVQFDTVMEKLYRQAIEPLLNGIHGATSATPVRSENAAAQLDGLPLKFHNAALLYLPDGQRLVSVAHWPGAQSGFNRQLTSAGALLLTDRELVLIAEEQPSPWTREASKIGEIITYFPLNRLAQFSITRDERLSILVLEVHASHGSEQLEIMFPSEHELGVSKLMEQVRP
jgi:hypothetical protein